jgi:hypothetical protein
MGMQIIPGNDPNEAMTLPFATGRRTGGPSPATAIPVHHFAPERRGLAERYQSNPEWGFSLVTRFVHDKPVVCQFEIKVDIHKLRK